VPSLKNMVAAAKALRAASADTTVSEPAMAT
jgi:hypothetical protein